MRFTPCLSPLLLPLFLAACADQRIRSEAQEQFRQGHYEEAVKAVEDGVKNHPDSPLLLATLPEMRSESLNRLLSEAELARREARLDDAEAALKRAKLLMPRHARVDALLSSLDTERRQQAALTKVEALIAQQQPDAALRLATEALRDNPRHAALRALQQRLEAQSRQAQWEGSRLALAETRPISLDFRDASLRSVLDVVSRTSGINFVLDKDIRQDIRVTVFLKSARVEDAIDLITSTYQLGKKLIDDQTLMIYPNTPEKQREHEEQVVRVFHLANADAKSAAAFLKSMLKVREPFVDDRSNMLALRDSPEVVRLAERLMTVFDTPQPEVLLEVQVVEIKTSRLTELGVKLPTSVGLTLLPPSGESGLTLGNLDGANRDRVAVSLGSVTLNLRREAGDYNILANPSIRARSKEKAHILIGDKLPVVTTTTGTNGFASDSVSYIDVGLKLEVQPTVYADDEVAINFALEVSSVSGQTKTNSGTTAYQINTRNASTLLRLHDGETQLLAGLISKEENTSASRVPGLGDLPVAGRLFSNTQDDSSRRELVLSITPHVLRNVPRMDTATAETWVGTEASPRLRPPGGAVRKALTAPTSAGANAQNPAQLVTPSGSSAATPSPSAPAAPAGARFQWEGPSEVKVGQELVLWLNLNSDLALRGVPLQVAVDTAHLSLVDVEEGDFFKRDGAPTSFTKSVENEGVGLRVGVLRNQATTIAGSGKVLKLTFKAKAAGEARVALVGAEPVSAGVPVAKSPLPLVHGLIVK